MRTFGSLLLFAALAGCIGAGGRSGPGEIPNGARGAMYSDLPAEQVAACFARAIGSSVQPGGGRFTVASASMAGKSYDIGPNAVGGIYPTEVILRGQADPAEEQRAAACFTTLPEGS